MHQPEISHVMTGDSAGSQRSKFGVNVAFPQIRRLHDMHVAVDNLESIFRHDSFLNSYAIAKPVSRQSQSIAAIRNKFIGRANARNCGGPYETSIILSRARRRLQVRRVPEARRTGPDSLRA